MPRRDRDADERDEDYDDRPPGRAVPSGGGVPAWAWALGAVGLLSLLGCGGIALLMFVAVRREPNRPNDPDPPVVVVKGAGPVVTPATKASITPPPPVLQPQVRLEAPAGKWRGNQCSVQVEFAAVFEDTLMVPVIVTTSDPKGKVPFRTWREPSRGSKGATLTDDNGTTYQIIAFDATIDGLIAPLLRERLKGEMGYGTGPVYSNQPRADMLLFERPAPGAAHLDLDLDAANVGDKGVIRFRIPRSVWSPKGKG